MGHTKDKHGRYNWPEELHHPPEVCPRCGSRVRDMTAHNFTFHPDPQQSLLAPVTATQRAKAAAFTPGLGQPCNPPGCSNPLSCLAKGRCWRDS